MKTYNQEFNLSKVGVMVYAMLIFVSVTAASTNVSDIPTQYQSSYYAWGAKTNGLRAGLAWDDEVHNGSKLQMVEALILTSNTNVIQDYVKPPMERFTKFELQNSNGIVIAPLGGKELDGELPQIIQNKNLPMTPKFGRNNSLPEGILPLFKNHAMPLKKFIVQEVYQIKKEGDYRITVWPAIYRFSTNGQFVSRIDLPKVSMKIHLLPSQERK